MLEVLITIIIVTLGLLGLAGLQARTQVAELEAYQRTQAIVLLQEMVDRIHANRQAAAASTPAYVTSSPVGTGNPIGTCTTAGMTVAEVDLCQWNNTLLGAAEDSGGTKLGAMIGARGCISNATNPNPTFSTSHEFMVAVVWQGLAPTTPPTTTTCGENLYGTGANADATRRAVVTRVMIGCLENYPVGHAQAGQCCPPGGC